MWVCKAAVCEGVRRKSKDKGRKKGRMKEIEKEGGKFALQMVSGGLFNVGFVAF